MLQLPDQALIDKRRLIGGCLRLGIEVQASLLKSEISALPSSIWGSRGGRVGVHSAAEAVFLRGHAPAEGAKPIEDRPTLDRLPYVRELLGGIIPAPPMRCLLARLPARATIAPHIDQADYFAKTIRLHVPVITNDDVGMYCAGYRYRMKPGEIWAINNSDVHAVWNWHASEARIHLIADFLPSEALLTLLANADDGLGVAVEDLESWLSSNTARGWLTDNA